MEAMVLLMVLGVMSLGVLGTLLWIWMLVECATKEPDHGNDKIIWVLIIVLTHWVGALIYFLVRRPQRLKETGA